MSKNCKRQSPARRAFKDYPDLSAKEMLVELFIVARVRPRTSKGITDLLLPPSSFDLEIESPSKKSKVHRIMDPRAVARHFTSRRTSPFTGQRMSRLISKRRSRSLTELTRQITPPTKNGHAPPTKESCKSSQSGNPSFVWTW